MIKFQLLFIMLNCKLFAVNTMNLNKIFFLLVSQIFKLKISSHNVKN